MWYSKMLHSNSKKQHIHSIHMMYIGMIKTHTIMFRQRLHHCSDHSGVGWMKSLTHEPLQQLLSQRQQLTSTNSHSTVWWTVAGVSHHSERTGSTSTLGHVHTQQLIRIIVFGHRLWSDAISLHCMRVNNPLNSLVILLWDAVLSIMEYWWQKVTVFRRQCFLWRVFLQHQLH